MSLGNPTSPLAAKAISLRAAVAFLGERAQAGWWDSDFLSKVGFQYLGLVFPRTTAAAALSSASEVACGIHDERIGRGKVAHLFRMPPELEIVLQRDLIEMKLGDLSAYCVADAAYAVLDTLSGGSKAVAGVGPVQVGMVKDAYSSAAVAKLAATYATGFRAGTPVFPYFA